MLDDVQAEQPVQEGLQASPLEVALHHRSADAQDVWSMLTRHLSSLR